MLDNRHAVCQQHSVRGPLTSAGVIDVDRVDPHQGHTARDQLPRTGFSKVLATMLIRPMLNSVPSE